MTLSSSISDTTTNTLGVSSVDSKDLRVYFNLGLFSVQLDDSSDSESSELSLDDESLDDEDDDDDDDEDESGVLSLLELDSLCFFDS